MGAQIEEEILFADDQGYLGSRCAGEYYMIRK